MKLKSEADNEIGGAAVSTVRPPLRGGRLLPRGVKKYIRRRKAVLRRRFTGTDLDRSVAELMQRFFGR